MRESILTIPINEVFDPKCGCPICRMRNMLENRTIEYIMGAAMMEPDVRIETNRLGFCHEHYSMMLKQKNRLSLALMLQSHLKEIQDNVLNSSRKNLFSTKNSKIKKTLKVSESCFVCEKIEWGMERLLRTFFEMYTNLEFKKLFNDQEMLCLPHFNTLCNIAPQYLQKINLDNFFKDAEALTKKYLNTLSEDVSKYCSMYDYRNTGKDADWGNSKDSIERAIAFLVSR